PGRQIAFGEPKILKSGGRGELGEATLQLEATLLRGIAHAYNSSPFSPLATKSSRPVHTALGAPTNFGPIPLMNSGPDSGGYGGGYISPIRSPVVPLPNT